jgi:hypothetical protein
MGDPPGARGTCLDMGAAVVDHLVSHQAPTCLGGAGAVYLGTAAINRKLGQIELGKKPQAPLGGHNAAMSKPDGLAGFSPCVGHACPAPVHVHAPLGSMVVDGPHHVSLGIEGVHTRPLGHASAIHDGMVMAVIPGEAARHPLMHGAGCEVLLGCSIHVMRCHAAMGECMAVVLA